VPNPKKQIRVDLPKISITGSDHPVVGTCPACENQSVLSWNDPQIGGICRDCAKLFIGLELQDIFPQAKWMGGPQ
jgi:hypothetical protein